MPGRDKHEPTQLLLCFGTRSFLCPRIHTPRAVPHALSSISCRVDAPSPSPPLRITSSIYRGPLRARTVSRRCPLCPRRNGPHPRVFDDGGLCRRACLALICELTLISMQGSFCTGRLSIQLKKKKKASLATLPHTLSSCLHLPTSSAAGLVECEARADDTQQTRVCKASARSLCRAPIKDGGPSASLGDTPSRPCCRPCAVKWPAEFRLSRVPPRVCPSQPLRLRNLPLGILMAPISPWQNG